MYGWHMQSWGGGGWILMVLVVLTFWTFVVLGAVVLARHFARRDARPSVDSSTNSREILRGRFARGEINETEFNELTNVLAKEPR